MTLLRLTCGDCTNCSEKCAYRDRSITELIRPAVVVPDWARQDAGLAGDAKLDCYVDEDTHELKLLTVGNTVAALDELYIWLSNPTAIEYIRNCLKRVRKKESAMLLASQNLEDFDQEGIREMTKPLFSIPPHQFLFNAGSIDKRSYMEMLQLDEAEYNLIKFPQRGVCLYKCGNERYPRHRGLPRTRSAYTSVPPE